MGARLCWNVRLYWTVELILPIGLCVHRCQQHDEMVYEVSDTNYDRRRMVSKILKANTNLRLDQSVLESLKLMHLSMLSLVNVVPRRCCPSSVSSLVGVAPQAGCLTFR